MGKMDVDGEKQVLWDVREEEFKECGFADACLSVENGDRA